MSGDTVVIPNTLTVQYNFTDPDKDNEGISQYKWYRFNNSTDTTGGTPIGTDSRTYTTGSADNLKWLRVEVTPVDEHGSVGTSVLSTAIQVGSS
jgi:hypothetical protein